MPSTVTVTVEQGGAGFAANEDLSVKKVDPEGRCDEAGVALQTLRLAEQYWRAGRNSTDVRRCRSESGCGESLFTASGRHM